jgi:hypothetical protein
MLTPGQDLIRSILPVYPQTLECQESEGSEIFDFQEVSTQNEEAKKLQELSPMRLFDFIMSTPEKLLLFLLTILLIGLVCCFTRTLLLRSASENFFKSQIT